MKCEERSGIVVANVNPGQIKSSCELSNHTLGTRYMNPPHRGTLSGEPKFPLQD